MIITGRQLRAACALAGLHQKSLAELSGVSVQTIQYMESFEDSMVGCKPLTLDKVMEALRLSDVMFIDGGVQMASKSGLLMRDPMQSQIMKPAAGMKSVVSSAGGKR
jgi:transcriptional regulator with XRE-family HTH domain